MSDSAIHLGAGRRKLAWLPRLALLLVAAALVLVALVPFGWRFGLWHFSISFAMAAWPWQLAKLRGPLPPINDITTDPDNPPVFAATLPAREAEHGVSAAYGGAATAAQQKAAYPDIAPATLPLPPDQAFARALAAAQGLHWKILGSDPKAGLIEASDTTLYFGFTDDIVIRVAADGAGSRVDIRSHSRQGRGDFGVNAKRVRKFLAAATKA
jgi:uncharacterized protein (DUF1499 family)